MDTRPGPQPAPAHPVVAPHGAVWRWRALLGFGALCFGLSVIMGRLAYDGGSEPVTVIASRFYGSFAVMALLVLVAGHNRRLAVGRRLAAFGLGVVVTLSSLAYFAAVERIPVSLAVLIFYTYPVVVGVLSRFTDGEPLTAGRLLLLLAAFVGIGLALDVQYDGLDPVGLLLACVPALGVGSITLFGGRLMRGGDVVLLATHAMLAGAVVMTLLVVVQGGPVWPAGTVGWVGFVGVPGCFVVANLIYYQTLARLRGSDVATIMNLEPVVTIAFAALLLGEILAPQQYAGAGLVVLAVFAMTALRR